MNTKNRFGGCLLGLAVGDAVETPLESNPLSLLAFLDPLAAAADFIASRCARIGLNEMTPDEHPPVIIAAVRAREKSVAVWAPVPRPCSPYGTVRPPTSLDKQSHFSQQIGNPCFRSIGRATNSLALWPARPDLDSAQNHRSESSRRRTQFAHHRSA
jgi:hypothetical protein